MRPPILNPLFARLNALTGIGPKLLKPFGVLLQCEEPRVIDLLFHLPYSAIDRRARPKLRDAVPDTIATLEIAVDKHQPGRGRAPYRILTSDDTGTLEIVYFNIPRERLEKMFPVGETRYVSGRVALYDGRLQMTHPDRVVDEKGLAQLAAVRAGLFFDGRSCSWECETCCNGGHCKNSRTSGMARCGFFGRKGISAVFGSAAPHACAIRAH